MSKWHGVNRGGMHHGKAGGTQVVRMTPLSKEERKELKALALWQNPKTMTTKKLFGRLRQIRAINEERSTAPQEVPFELVRKSDGAIIISEKIMSRYDADRKNSKIANSFWRMKGY